MVIDSVRVVQGVLIACDDMVTKGAWVADCVWVVNIGH
jgi:hypothetical protein